MISFSITFSGVFYTHYTSSRYLFHCEIVSFRLNVSIILISSLCAFWVCPCHKTDCCVYVCTIIGSKLLFLASTVSFFWTLLSYVAGSSKIRELAFLLHMTENIKEKNSTITQAEGFYKVCSYMLTHSYISLFEMAKFDGFKIVDSCRA